MKSSKLVKRQILLQDNDEQDELHTLYDLPDDDDDERSHSITICQSLRFRHEVNKFLYMPALVQNNFEGSGNPLHPA